MVPDLAGRSVDAALRILRARGEESPEIIYVEDAGPPHVVLGQEASETTTLEVSGRNPIRHLPGIFRRADRDGGGFLERMLWPFAHLLADLDRKIRQAPSLLDPAVTPDTFLPWLRRLVALPWAGGRQAVLRAPELWRRKGTARGIREGLRHLLGLEATIRQDSYSLLPWRIGEGSIVGESRLPDRGAALPVAFEVLLPARIDSGRTRTLRRLLDLLKPAHTICRIRFDGEEPDRPRSHRIGVTRLEDPHGAP